MEYTDDDVLYYIDDEQGNEIGFAILEDGKEVEYFYADSIGDKASHAVNNVVDGVVDGVKDAMSDNPFVSAEGVSNLRDDLNVIYHENKETISSLRSVADDMKELKNLLTGKMPSSRSEAAPSATPGKPQPSQEYLDAMAAASSVTPAASAAAPAASSAAPAASAAVAAAPAASSAASSAATVATTAASAVAE